MKDQVFEEFRNDCITAMGTCCRKYGYHKKQAFVRNQRKYYYCGR